ncbi:hypothetical protein [Acholeplasma hippikon]|uniref:Uncharacterized protein n=1 Tax=Acholeplasma hippikon TaxID=264636 RepID=A0A449BLL0_9MOLU|nr:hypothetical protein [Acholeplasma hippikon]VEU83325.1 Uncharacterised protein [Acholeplasma hippikon]
MIKKLYISIIAFSLAIIATTTATYAWLSMATSNAVQGLGLNTHNGDQLEISVDGVNYYTSLPSEEVLGLIQNLVFTDITSMDGKKFSYGVRNDKFEAIKNKDYISIDFFFRTVSPYYHEVFLTNNISNEVTYNEGRVGTYIVSKGRTWISNVGFQYGPDEYIDGSVTKTYYVSDAMRVSFVEHSDNGKVKIFDLSGNEERGYGKPYGAVAYYEALKGTLQLPSEVPDTIYKLSDFDKENPYALDNRSHILTLKYDGHHADSGLRLYEGKVTMNIWVEGWDADLFDAVFGDQVKMQFQFKSVIGIKN